MCSFRVTVVLSLPEQAEHSQDCKAARVCNGLSAGQHSVPRSGGKSLLEEQGKRHKSPLSKGAGKSNNESWKN